MPEVRPAAAGDIEAICRLLHGKMSRKISTEGWRAIMTYGWLPEKPDLGIVAEAKGEIVGFLGVVYADRTLGDLCLRTANLSAWYLDKPHRGAGLGMEMLRAATRHDGVLYTTFSSVPRVLPMMEKIGLEPLDRERLVWRRSAAAGRPSDLRVLRGMDAVAPLVSPAERRLLADHAGFDLHPFLIEVGGRSCLLIMSIRRKAAGVAYHEAFYIADPALFAAHAQAFADAILPDRESLVAVDRRFLDGIDVRGGMEEIPVPRYFRPTPGVTAREVDFLYSETALLNLKLY